MFSIFPTPALYTQNLMCKKRFIIFLHSIITNPPEVVEGRFMCLRRWIRVCDGASTLKKIIRMFILSWVHSATAFEISLGRSPQAIGKCLGRLIFPVHSPGGRVENVQWKNHLKSERKPNSFGRVVFSVYSPDVYFY